MKVYAINVTSRYTWVKKLSQEGYTSLESAYSFVVNREDNPEKIGDMTFVGDDYVYDIVEISIT